jgi:tetratricopeptide (TPR) repeat protein
LQASTLFQLPVPLTVWGKFAADANLGRPDRLLAFGLWERLPDIAAPHADAAGPNRIAAARLPPLPEEDKERAIGAVLPDLFAAWGGIDRLRPPYVADIELTRLALASGNLDMLAMTAVFAIQGLEGAFAYREAAATATSALDALQGGGRTTDLQLLRAGAEVFDRVGDPHGLQCVYANAAELVVDDPSEPNETRLARAQFRMRYGDYLRQLGEPDKALVELQAAAIVLEALGHRRSRAVALNAIAGIMRAQGAVDEALKLHNEVLQICEALGDHRSRAAALGCVARIMGAKGGVDHALNLYYEQLQIFEVLGDRGSRAATLGEIARIKSDRGEVDEALELHKEQLRTFEAVGDRRSRAVTLGDVAKIMRDKGDVDEALKLHDEELKTYEALGDRRSRAITLGDIARIMIAKGDVGRSLELHNEVLKTYEALGDRRLRAVALGDIALIMRAMGEVDEALRLQEERLEVNR